MRFVSSKYHFRENVIVLVSFSVIVHSLYLRTWQAGFVTDFTGLQERLDGAVFADFLHCFGFPALHQVTNFFLYLFYKLFGTLEWPWYLVYTSLHITNGLLGYHLVKKLFAWPLAVPAPPSAIHATLKSNAPLKTFSVPALLAALLFLISPYNAETVIWKVCFNFLFCTGLMYAALLHLMRYAEHKNNNSLLFVHLLFIIALFTFELALALPLLTMMIIFWWQAAQRKPHFLTKTFLPVTGIQLLITGIYFLLNKLLLGGWVGHYGEDVHLNFDLKNIVANSLKYFAKNLVYWRDWEHPLKQSFISFSEHPFTFYITILFGITLFISVLLFYKKMPVVPKKIFFLWSLFFLALSPIINLYVAWVLHGENDRYGYFASLFFYAGLIFIFQLTNKKIQHSLYAIVIIISIFNLNKINTYWQKSTIVVNDLLSDFKWESNREIFVLAFPENYLGIPMFKDFSRKNMALKSALKYKSEKIINADFYQVAQFNMNQPQDGLTATIDSSNTVKLEFHEWGNWWWRHGIGTGPYETNRYVFKPVGKGCEFRMKEPAKNAVYIYSDGGRWKELLFNTTLEEMKK